MTHDALYNLHELAYDLEDYIRTIQTYPDLIVVCGLTSIVKEMNSVLLQTGSELSQLLSYTTFQLGDFYLSPALFLIHERKYQEVHEEFMSHVSTLVPNLVNGKVIIPMVTDEEVGIYQVRTCKLTLL